MIGYMTIIICHSPIKQKKSPTDSVGDFNYSKMLTQPFTLANLACLMLLILRSCNTFTASST